MGEYGRFGPDWSYPENPAGLHYKPYVFYSVYLLVREVSRIEKNIIMDYEALDNHHKEEWQNATEEKEDKFYNNPIAKRIKMKFKKVMLAQELKIFLKHLTLVGYANGRLAWDGTLKDWENVNDDIEKYYERN